MKRTSTHGQRTTARRRALVSCDAERRALAVAIELLAGVLLACTFVDESSPIPGDNYQRLDWARARLRPLLPYLAAVRRACGDLDWAGSGRLRNDQRAIRRRLDRLARDVVASVRGIVAARSTAVRRRP